MQKDENVMDAERESQDADENNKYVNGKSKWHLKALLNSKR
jgi:hypothetical protein